MPLIDGQKMACEPCIRGHRSSKCSHQYERVMVHVRKPGRPLSTCPHPSVSAPICACRGVVTAAIPLRQTCHCGPRALQQPAADDLGQPDPTAVATAAAAAAAAAIKIETEESLSSSSSPTIMFQARSLTMAPTPPYRVHKTGGRGTGRKMSIDPASLDKMDPSQVNILSVPPRSQTGGEEAMAPQYRYGTPQMAGPSAFSPPSRHPTMYPPYGAPNGHGHGGDGMPPMANGGITAMANGGPVPNGGIAAMANGGPVPNGAAVQGRGSCCSSSASSSSTNGTAAPNSIPIPKPAAPAHPHEIKIAGCCSSGGGNSKSKSAGPAPEAGEGSRLDMLPSTSAALSNGLMMPSSFQQQHSVPQPPVQVSQNPMYSPYYPTVFTYPPSYGSFMQPLQPYQWRQIMENMSFSQVSATQSPAGPTSPLPQRQPHPQHPQQQRQQSRHSFPAIPPHQAVAHPFPLQAGTSGAPGPRVGTTHECGCGTGCQCIGCAAHPYNDATQAYVRSAYNSMLEGSPHDRSNSIDPNGAGAAASAGVGTAKTNNSIHAAPGPGMPPVTAQQQPPPPQQLHHHSAVPVEGGASPTTPHTPASDTTSGAGEDQTYSAEDFFFVTYPFSGEPCGGEQATCPCGDDCDCLGCTIHTNNRSNIRHRSAAGLETGGSRGPEPIGQDYVLDRKPINGQEQAPLPHSLPPPLPPPPPPAPPAPAALVASMVPAGETDGGRGTCCGGR